MIDINKERLDYLVEALKKKGHPEEKVQDFVVSLYWRFVRTLFEQFCFVKVKRIKYFLLTQLVAHHGDVNNPDHVQKLVKTTIEKFGRLDYVVSQLTSLISRKFLIVL